MTYDEMNSFILNYLKNDKTGRAIMLTAEWGSGKSYYVKTKLKSFLEDKKNGNEMFELSDNQVEQVAGGHHDGGASGSDVGEDPKVPECPKCGSCNRYYIKPTGATRKGSWLGLIDDKQYYCEYCGTYFWDWGPDD